VQLEQRLLEIEDQLVLVLQLLLELLQLLADAKHLQSLLLVRLMSELLLLLLLLDYVQDRVHLLLQKLHLALRLLQI